MGEDMVWMGGEMSWIVIGEMLRVLVVAEDRFCIEAVQFEAGTRVMSMGLG